MKKTILALCLILCIIAGACTALADAMTFRDEDGNVLEQGASLSGKYYYRVYVEGVAEDCEAIQTGWVHDAAATEPVDWETNPRHLYTDEKGTFFYVIPILGADYTEETMFARRDENDPDLARLVFYYDRETIIESEIPEFLNKEDPVLGQTDYELIWTDVEGAEFYQLVWIKPDGTVHSILTTDHSFSLDYWDSNPSDQVGEYNMYVFPFGNGLQMTPSYVWYYEIAE